MAKARPEKQAAKAPAVAKPTQSAGWPLWARLAVSVWVVWHLFAVFISPFGVPPSSQLVREFATSPWVRWYSDPVYINGGYHFFGPDPPLAGLLVRYEVTSDVGEVLVRGEFPNRANDGFNKQWPRLWYHRHMMLADQTGEAAVNFDQQGRPNREANVRLTLRAYARHLLRKHGGATAKLEYIEHRSLGYDEVFPDRPRQLGLTPDGWEPPAALDPTDASLYRVLQTVVEHADQLQESLLPATLSATRPGASAVPSIEPLPLGPGTPLP